MSEQSPRRRPRPAGVIVIGLIALISLFAIASLSLDKGDEDPIRIEGAGAVQRLLGGIPQLGNRLGEDDAEVTVEVFNDLQCKDCSSYQLDVIEPLIADQVRGGEIKLIYRHYSMSERERGLASFGAVAAGKQAHEWQFIELFFRNQSEAERRGVSDEFLDVVAGGILEFNAEQWQRDRDDSDITDTLDGDNLLAAERKLPAEPAVIVDGPGGTRQLIESPSLAEIEQAILEVR